MSSSTYEWIIEDTNGRGLPTRITVGLGDVDGTHRTAHNSLEWVETSSGRRGGGGFGAGRSSQRVSSGSGTRSSAESHRLADVQSEGKSSHSRRSSSSRAASHRRRHHAGAGLDSAGGNGARPAWMTSVYGADNPNAPGTEWPISATRRPRAQAASAGKATTAQSHRQRAAVCADTAAETELHVAFVGSSRTVAGGARAYEELPSAHARDDWGADSGAPTSELAAPRRRTRRKNRYTLPVDVSVVYTASTVMSSSSSNSNSRSGSGADDDDEAQMDEEDEDQGEEEDEDDAEEERCGASLPVTATFYFTPNTNAEARASAQAAMRGRGLLYPLPPSAPHSSQRARSRVGGADGADLRYSDKSRRKTAQPQAGTRQDQLSAHEKLTNGNSDDDNDDDAPLPPPRALASASASFAARVESLATRARRQLHHMPDYDSEQDARASGSGCDQSPQDSTDGRPSILGTVYSDAEETARRSLSVSSTGSDFHRFQREQLDARALQLTRRQWAREGAAAGQRRAVPLPPPPQELYDTSGFFISPIHQSVAEATAPWSIPCAGNASAMRAQADDQLSAGGRHPPRARPHADAFSYVFLGQGGLSSMPSEQTAVQQRDQQQPQQRNSSSSSALSRGRVQSAAPLTDALLSSADFALASDAREMEKAVEESLLDNLSAVLADNSRRGPARQPDGGTGRSGGPCTQSQQHFEAIRRVSPTPALSAPAPSMSPGCRLGGRLRGRKRGHDECSDDSLECAPADASCDDGTSSASSSSGRAGGQVDALPPSEKHDAHVLQNLRKRRSRRRRLERRANRECGGSLALCPRDSPSIAPPLDLLPASNTDMREDLLESFFMDRRLREDDFKLF